MGQNQQPAKQSYMTPEQQQLFDLAHWANTNGAVHGEVNDTVFINNLIECRAKYAALGRTFEDFSKALVYERKKRVHEAAQKLEVEVVKEKAIKHELSLERMQGSIYDEDIRIKL